MFRHVVEIDLIKRDLILSGITAMSALLILTVSTVLAGSASPFALLDWFTLIGGSFLGLLAGHGVWSGKYVSYEKIVEN